MKMIIATTFAILMTGIGPLLAQSPENVQVTVSGIGTSAETAEKDALVRAVKVAVGSYVDSETLVRNDELIREQILEASGSYVKTYDLVGEPTKRNDGLWEVEIQAVVQGGQVVDKLKTINIVSSGVETKDVVAEALGKRKNAKDGAEILIKQFPKDMISKLLVARLIDKQGRPTSEIVPETRILNDGRIAATWYVEIYFDSKKFYENVVPPLDRILSAISSSTGGPIVSVGEQNGTLQLTEYPIFSGRKWQGASPSQPQGDQPYVYFFLSTGRSEKGGSERWQWYLLEGNDYIKAFTKTNLTTQWLDTTLNISMLADDGGVVWGDAVEPWTETLVFDKYGRQGTDNHLPFFLAPDYMKEPLEQNIFLSPRFGESSSTSYTTYHAGRITSPSSYYGHTDTLVKKFETILAPEDLKRIQQIRFHFTTGTPLE